MNLLRANDRDGHYPPSWYAATVQPLPPFPPIDVVRRADVVVVGGGYTGLSAALHLARSGLQVVLLEAQRVGFGASGRNGGQVGSGQRLPQDVLERMVGADAARRLWEVAEDAKALVRSLIADHAIPADWQDGVAHPCWRPSEVAAAEAEAAHLSRGYGYDRVERLDRGAMADLLGTGVFAGGVIDHGAGHIQPLAFALGLAQAAAAAGVAIHEGSEVTAIAEGRPVTVHTATGSVTADHLILACNGYLGRLVPAVSARVMPINNFIVATETLGARAPMPRPVAAADTKFVVNYWRQTRDGRLLFGGGYSYGYRFPADIAALVRKPMRMVYPQLADVRIDHAWGGTLAITMTRAPAFLRVAPNVLTASGYSGHGVAMATMAGRILAEAVVGQAGRFDLMAGLPVPKFPGGLAFRSPLLALAMTWYALRDRLGL